MIFTPAIKAMQEQRGSRKAYARVEAHGGFPSEVTAELAEFLATIETAFLATASADGQPYVQHRGGPPGFLRVLDDRTIGFTDYPGNRQYISLGNLSENDKVCLIAMDYANQRRVKIWGRARVVDATILIEITAWDVNCPKHIPRLVKVPTEDR